MDVSVRELRNHTARVVRAVESGEPVVLTVHGRPVADIIPRTKRSVVRPSAVVMAELAELAEIFAEAREAGMVFDPSDYDTGLTTEDMLPRE